jgi:hypothetical protein
MSKIEQTRSDGIRHNQQRLRFIRVGHKYLLKLANGTMVVKTAVHHHCVRAVRGETRLKKLATIRVIIIGNSICSIQYTIKQINSCSRTKKTTHLRNVSLPRCDIHSNASGSVVAMD